MFILLSAMTTGLFAQGYCLDFDGTNDYVNVGTINTDFSGGLTIEAYAYYNSFNYWSRIVDFGLGASNYNILFANEDYYANLVFEVYTTISGGKTIASGVLETGKWMHLAVTEDGSGNVIIYKNGVQVKTGTTAIPAEGPRTKSYIAKSNWFSDECFDGKLDEIRVWNIVRTQAEIQNNMNTELTGNESGLVAYYKFNEGTGQIATDSAGNYNGTLGDSTGSDSADPTWITSDAPLPVTLSSFTAVFSNGSSVLQWTTQSESNNQGWNIYRSENENFNESFQINGNLIPGAGTSTEPIEYSFEDEHPVENGKSYHYWLESRDFSGDTKSFGPISFTVPENNEENPDDPNTAKYGLFQNYPNPVSNSTTISFNLPEAANCILNIYNSKGQLIKTLNKDNAISDSFIWNGTNNRDEPVSSGIYLFKLEAGDKTYIKKMLFMD